MFMDNALMNFGLKILGFRHHYLVASYPRKCQHDNSWFLCIGDMISSQDIGNESHKLLFVPTKMSLIYPRYYNRT